MLPVVRVTRYVTPLREGGSLPGIVQADDLGHYVSKFRGAGQGLPVLVAEVIVARIAEQLGLLTPRLVGLELSRELARYEADEEVQDLLVASVGLNLGVDFLPGAFGVDSTLEVDPDTAATVLWLDAFVANVDRTWRNPNLLLWHGDLWLIDHGASLYFHHSWGAGVGDPSRFASQPYDAAGHVFASAAGRARELDTELAARVTDELLAAAIEAVPADWLGDGGEERRDAYLRYLSARRDGVDGVRTWLP